MSGVNKVIIVGRLGKEPEVRTTQAGTQVTNIVVATSESWKDQQGQKQEKTEWHRITFFGRVAEVAATYLKKGDQVFVEGRIETSKFEKDGQTRYSTSIIARDMTMLGSSNGGGEGQSQGSAGEVQETQDIIDLDDIPF
jgi:single-strand DNA-binding protein